jgi:hypothetical protein
MRTCINFFTRAIYDDISSSFSSGYQVVQKRFVKRAFEQCGGNCLVPTKESVVEEYVLQASTYF